MKIYLIIVFLFCINNFVNAQQKIMKLGSFPDGIDELSKNDTIYYKDLNNILDKYIGTWNFENDSVYFQISINKKLRIDSFPRVNIKFDELVSEFIYKNKDVEIYNTKNEDSYISGNLVFSENKISLLYTEPTKNNYVRYKQANLMIEFILDETPKLIWVRKNYDICWGTGEKPIFDMSDFKIPEKMLLTKQQN